MSCPFAEPPPRNRLTIAHLMLWTLGSAIALGLYRATTLAEQQSGGRFTQMWQVHALLDCLPAGARIAAVFLLGWKFARGDRSFPVQPGHWLLVVEGISALLSWIGRGAVLLFFNESTRSVSLIAIAQLPDCVITASAFVVAIHSISGESRLWKAIFWLRMFEYAVLGLMFGALVMQFLNVESLPSFAFIRWFWLFNIQSMCCQVILLVLLPAAALSDPCRNHRDFLHWTGIVATFATTVFTLSARWLVKLS